MFPRRPEGSCNCCRDSILQDLETLWSLASSHAFDISEDAERLWLLYDGRILHSNSYIALRSHNTSKSECKH